MVVCKEASKRRYSLGAKVEGRGWKVTGLILCLSSSIFFSYVTDLWLNSNSMHSEYFCTLIIGEHVYKRWPSLKYLIFFLMTNREQHLWFQK